MAVNFSGSLVITGSLTTTGGITISGSIASASFASTASFVALAQSASNAVAAQTASFANAFTVAGNLTAQTLVVQTVSSSVIYSSGSNVFGNNIANTQVFTGSMNLTGSLTVVTNGTEFQVTSTGVRLGNISADTHTITGSLLLSGSQTISNGDLTISGNRNIYLSNSNPAAGVIRFYNATSGSTKSAIGSYFNVADEGNLEFLTGGTTTRMIISSSGNVGIGTTTIGGRLDVQAAGTSAFSYYFRNSAGGYGGGVYNTGTNNTQLYLATSAGTENVLISATGSSYFNGGNVGIGVTNPASSYGFSKSLVVSHPTNSEISLEATTSGKVLSMGVTNGLNYFQTTAGNGYDFQIGGVSRFVISNTGAISTSSTISAGGNISMAQFVASALFSSYTGDGLFNANSRYCSISTPGAADRIRFGYNDYGSGQYWGRIGFAANTNWSLGIITGAGNDFSIGTGYQGQQFYIYANGNYDFTGSDVSDRRKKTNINYITSNQLDNILKLKPVTFNKIAGEAIGENIHTGFIAQDIMEEGLPNLVMGSDEGGYGLDYNGILALAVKAIQELQAQITELKNK